jgi:hypothetical protein
MPEHHKHSDQGVPKTSPRPVVKMVARWQSCEGRWTCIRIAIENKSARDYTIVKYPGNKIASVNATVQMEQSVEDKDDTSAPEEAEWARNRRSDRRLVKVWLQMERWESRFALRS